MEEVMSNYLKLLLDLTANYKYKTRGYAVSYFNKLTQYNIGMQSIIVQL